MKVYVLPADAHGCGHYRLIWPAQVCQRLGIDVQIMPPKKDSGFRAKVRETAPGVKELVSIEVPQDADVIVLQRPAHPFQPQMIDMLRSNKIAVVVDMDDDMTAIHPKNVAYSAYHPRSNSPFSWKHATESCRRATFVTVSTPALQRTYGYLDRSAVLENCVPAAVLSYNKPVTGSFGWAGTTQSHPDDLQVVGNAVQRLIDDGEQFRVIGPPSGVKEALRLKEEPNYTGVVALDQWIKICGENMDVAMVPLSPSPFNSAKSYLKGIEAMAAGVPWVASPRTEYTKLQKRSGCGFLAVTGKDWYNHLKRLLGDEPLRKEQAEMGREWMKQQTYEARAHLWAEVWERALKLERG